MQKATNPADLTDMPTIKEIGLTVLAQGGTDPELDIVLIHGLQGHPYRTWAYSAACDTNRSPVSTRGQSHLSKIFSRLKSNEPSSATVPSPFKVYWPLDLLSCDFPRARIATFGYDSKITHWFKGPAMQLDIFSYGESLLNSLEARRRVDPQRPLIFIVHSLGGLVLKDALRRARAASEARFRAVYDCVKAIVFFGTPHRGGCYVNLGSTVRKIVACGGFDTSAVNLRDLKFDSSVAKLLREEFAKMMDERKPRIYTLQEAKGLTGFGPLSGKVVEDNSSALDYAFEQKDFIGANHMDMCKFSGAEDDGYCKIKDYLSLCIDYLDRDEQQVETFALQQSILASLHIPETKDRFDQIEDAYEKTCDWIFSKKSLDFVKWLEYGRSGMFWINGKPGSGKSTLMKFIVSDPRTFQHLYMNNCKHRLLWASFFFSNRGQLIQKSLLGLYHRILYQLLSQAEFLTPFVQPIFEVHYESQGSWSISYLESALLNIVRYADVKVTICLFIDALDEHEEGYLADHQRLVFFLENLINNASRMVKVMLCLSSRPDNFFQDSFSRWPSLTIHEHTQFDVKTYVEGRFDSYLASRPDLVASPHAVSTLSETSANIIARAQGVFLWVKLITTDLLEALMDGESPTDVKQRLFSLPGNGDLHELYRLILVRLNRTYLREAYVMLQIAYATTQVLPVSEFFEAVHYVQKITAHFEEHEMERKIRSRCRGFLEIQLASWQDERTDRHYGRVVQFLHQSVKDYLMSTKSFDTMRTQLGILPSDNSQNGHVYLLKFRTSQHLYKYEDNPAILAELPAFDLRRFEVFYQARMVEKVSPLLAARPLDALAKFIDLNELAGSYLRIDGWNVPSSWKPTFLSLAVQAGLTAYVEMNLRSPAYGVTSVGRPLLHYASVPIPPGLSGSDSLPFVSNPAMIKLLATLGTNVNETFENRTAFTMALEEYVKRGHASDSQLKMLDALLVEGSDPDFPIPISPSRNAAEDGEIAKNFERSLLPPKTTTALCIAVRKADKPLTSLLLERKARTSEMTAQDWDDFESNTRPMSLWNAFRCKSLGAQQLEAFRQFYSQDDKKQNPQKLLKLYPRQLEVRVTVIPAGPRRPEEKRLDVFVTDHQLILESEPAARQYLDFYGREDILQPGLPKTLRNCSPLAQSRILAHWASPPKSVRYF